MLITSNSETEFMRNSIVHELSFGLAMLRTRVELVRLAGIMAYASAPDWRDILVGVLVFSICCVTEQSYPLLAVLQLQTPVSELQLPFPLQSFGHGCCILVLTVRLNCTSTSVFY